MPRNSAPRDPNSPKKPRELRKLGKLHFYIEGTDQDGAPNGALGEACKDADEASLKSLRDGGKRVAVVIWHNVEIKDGKVFHVPID